MKRWKYLHFFAACIGFATILPHADFASAQLKQSLLQVSDIEKHVDSGNVASFDADPKNIVSASLPVQHTASSTPMSYSPVLMQATSGWVKLGVGVFVIVVITGAAIAFISSSAVRIKDNEIGIVFKKFTINPFHEKLSPGCRIALYGEEGCQADILPAGRHFGNWPWMYEIRRVPIIDIPQGQIALVVANEGGKRSDSRLLAKVVPCDDFQSARKFLLNGGEKGQQLGILTAGKYGINTELFTVVTQSNAKQYGVDANDLKVYKVAKDKVGIVTINEGQTLSFEADGRSVISPVIQGHSCFQEPQKFIEDGGFQGPQEQVLQAGFWALNPWFASVEQVPITKVDAGTVGVVIAQDGKDAIGKSDNGLVEANVGYRGIWNKPLLQGKYPINPDFLEVEIVPTNKISLEWSNEDKDSGNYDSKLKTIHLYSKDGFEFRD